MNKLNNEDHNNSVIFSMGNYTNKIGFNKNDEPKFIERSMYSSNNGQNILYGSELSNSTENHRFFNINDNIDSLENYLNKYMFDKLKLNKGENPILVTHNHEMNLSNKIDLVQLIFEKFNAPLSLLANEQLMNLYSVGKTTGIVVDLGYTHSRSILFQEGIINNYSYKKSLIGGKLINKLTKNFLIKNNLYNVGPDNEYNNFKMEEIYEFIKKKIYLNHEETELVLPDNNKLNKPNFLDIKNLLFEKKLINQYNLLENFNILPNNINEVIYDSYINSDYDNRREIFNNVVLTGGTAKFNNLENEVKNKIEDFCPNLYKINIITYKDKEISNWVGASLLSSLGGFNNSWITKKEYEENGNSILYKKLIL